MDRLRSAHEAAAAGYAPPPTAPADSDLLAAERIAIDYADSADLATKSAAALKGLEANQLPIWKALRNQGIFRGRGSRAPSCIPVHRPRIAVWKHA